jgi:hypothetical protein
MSAPNMRTTNESLAGRRTIIGVFDGPNHAEMALNELRNAGFTPEQVSVVAKDTRETKDMVENTGMGGGEGVATGAVLGGITGGVLGWLVGIGALAIPGIGPIVAAGALATTLGGAAVGAAAGGLIGALVDLGVPEEDARGYHESVRAGSILLSVNALSAQEASRAREIFDRHGGSDVRYYGEGDIDETDDTGAKLGGAAAGGVTGAVAGGAIGTAVGGPVGTAAGAAIGGAAGAAAGHKAGDVAEDAVDDDDREVRQGRTSDLQTPAEYRDDAIRRDDDSAARI